MQFKIDIEDFWLDDNELEPVLKAHIIDNVVSQIAKSIEDKVNKRITEKVDKTIDRKLSTIIDRTLKELMTTQTIMVNKQPIKIVDYLKKKFEDNHGWGNPLAQLERFATKFGDDMKIQYNAAFANQIVAQMKEQGFLKDEVTQILLGGKK